MRQESRKIVALKLLNLHNLYNKFINSDDIENFAREQPNELILDARATC